MTFSKISAARAVQMNNSSVVEVDYVHVLGLHENKTVNVNPTDPNNGFARGLTDDFVPAGVPVLGSVRVEESVNRSRYDGVNFSFRQRLFFLSLSDLEVGGIHLKSQRRRTGVSAPTHMRGLFLRGDAVGDFVVLGF